MGIQVREGSEAARLLANTGDHVLDAEVRAERALLAELHGGCSVPIGAYSKAHRDGTLTLSAQVSAVDGSERLTAQSSGSVHDPEKLGRRVAEELLDQGSGGDPLRSPPEATRARRSRLQPHRPGEGRSPSARQPRSGASEALTVRAEITRRSASYGVGGIFSVSTGCGY
ncbi:hypothetical protein ACFWAT_01650 [Streptomyces syringium]|uniref:hypothetical protein n=1 Tax=Streptomyces syringium TaxID=76729 RepID=UPI0036540105